MYDVDNMKSMSETGEQFDVKAAIANDTAYDEHWKKWILSLRSQLGTYELSELIFRASEHYQALKRSSGKAAPTESGRSSASAASNSTPDSRRAFFAVQDGRIARANIGRDPLYFFAALQRQLNYPEVPLSKKVYDESLPPILEARLVKIEQRLKIVELEQKGGIDLTKFYKKEDGSVPEDFTN